MAVRHSVRLPRLGDTTNSVVVLEWIRSVGDTVQEGDPLIRVETDKVELDVPSPVGGKLIELRAAVDEEVSTGDVICMIET